MPKMTRKYSAAQNKAFQIKISIPNDAEQLYKALVEIGYQWDSDKGKWTYLPAEPADAPTDLLMVRVWAEKELVAHAADRIVKHMASAYQLIERSDPYPCRPPKQLESRIYLKFMPK